ncbi:MAG: aminotransferase class V-fold PLP-dependent enzyme [Bacteroidetes bacterium]|nr:aminotransferase class V-fold PLP-dependent enzyme [Bacteroidota bacterium]
MQRRTFIRNSGMGLAAWAALPQELPGFDQVIPDLNAYAAGHEGLSLVEDEGYWDIVRTAFRREGNYINLENGYFSPQAEPVLLSTQRNAAYINATSSHFMRREQEQAIETARTALAGFLGVDVAELALTRNTTESLNTVIAGFPWLRGDEVVIGNQDYGSMNEAFEQNARRYGFSIKTAEVPLLPQSDEEIVKAYTRHIGIKTRMLHLTHLINLSGQVIPVVKIARAARAINPGICVVVDAAHSIAQLNFRLPDLEADIVGASLHKWLCNPLGAGMLWMKRDWIPRIWPLMGDTGAAPDNIRRFEHQGTRPLQNLMSIPHAIAFHRSIGTELKEARLKFLMKRWASAAAEMPALHLQTPWSSEGRNSAIATVNHDSLSPGQLAQLLFDKHKIFTVAIEHPIVKGVRITPHLYTSLNEVDALIRALRNPAGS